VSQRDAILKRIRRGLNRGPLDDKQSWPLTERLVHPTPGHTPAASRGTQIELVKRFTTKMRAVDASVAGIERFADIPAAVLEYLGGPAPVRVAPHPDLEGLAWDSAGIEASIGIARAADTVGIGRAYAGVAESGTLVFCSGAESPTTLNFLPDTHIAVLPIDAVVGPYEAVWERLRDSGPERAFLPRTVNWITGPSRTADIEQTLQLGIHGPRHLHVLLIWPGLLAEISTPST